MYSSIALLTLQKFNYKLVLAKFPQRNLAQKNQYISKSIQPDAGFSLIEVITVVLMIGILAAMALPSWSAFVNRQTLGKANEAVLDAIQEAQRQAKQKKLNYSVSFRKSGTNQPIQVAIYPTLKSDGTTRTVAEINTWTNLGGDAGINSRQLLLGANLNAENTVDSSNSSISFSLANPPKITFDYMGTLRSASFGSIPTGGTEPPGLRIALAMPTGSNSTSPSAVRRCVIIRTLLGSVQAEQNDGCS
ncbi:MAG TPA: type II secretion system protein [Leptolyngbyaceae cyanobacterium]